MPEQFVRYGETWRKHHPEWEMRLWSEADLERPEFDREVIDRGRHHAERADVFRLQILCHFGGVYVDTDFECLRSIEPLIDDVGAFAAWFEPDGSRTNNAFLGFVPRHPALLRALSEIRPRVGNGDYKTMAGPLFLDRVIREFPDVRLFPRELFYLDPVRDIDLTGAYALHHSARSWKTREQLLADVDKWRRRSYKSNARGERLARKLGRTNQKIEKADRRASQRVEKAERSAEKAERRLVDLMGTRWWRLGRALGLVRVRGGGRSLPRFLERFQPPYS
jgi:mannosyltransferase OCH1-like enzyme